MIPSIVLCLSPPSCHPTGYEPGRLSPPYLSPIYVSVCLSPWSMSTPCLSPWSMLTHHLSLVYLSHPPTLEHLHLHIPYFSPFFLSSPGLSCSPSAPGHSLKASLSSPGQGPQRSPRKITSSPKIGVFGIFLDFLSQYLPDLGALLGAGISVQMRSF